MSAFWAAEMDKWVLHLFALAEDPGCIPSTLMMATPAPRPSLTFDGTLHTRSTHKYMQAK